MWLPVSDPAEPGGGAVDGFQRLHLQQRPHLALHEPRGQPRPQGQLAGACLRGADAASKERGADPKMHQPTGQNVVPRSIPGTSISFFRGGLPGGVVENLEAKQTWT